jgi:uncharacterized protein (DUF924 family)
VAFWRVSWDRWFEKDAAFDAAFRDRLICTWPSPGALQKIENPIEANGRAKKRCIVTRD